MSLPRGLLVLLPVTVLLVSCISGTIHHHHQAHGRSGTLLVEEVARDPATTPRRSSYVARDSHEFDAGLFKRDICNATFPGRVTDLCGTEATTCCIIPGQARPACVQILGKGACCTEDNNCYVDTKSDCGPPENEHCASDICCPRDMYCSSAIIYTNPDNIRCYFNRGSIPDYVFTSKVAQAALITPMLPIPTESMSMEKTSTEFTVSAGPSLPNNPVAPLAPDWSYIYFGASKDSKLSRTESPRTISSSRTETPRTEVSKARFWRTESSDRFKSTSIETIDPTFGNTSFPANGTIIPSDDGINADIRGASIAGVAVGAILTVACIGSIAGYCVLKRIRRRTQPKPNISYPILPSELSDCSQIFESHMEQIYEAQTSRGPFFEFEGTEVYEAPSVNGDEVHEIKGCAPTRIHEAPSGKGAFFDARASPGVERQVRVEMPADPPRSMRVSILKAFSGQSGLRSSNSDIT